MQKTDVKKKRNVKNYKNVQMDFEINLWISTPVEIYKSYLHKTCVKFKDNSIGIRYLLNLGI